MFDIVAALFQATRSQRPILHPEPQVHCLPLVQQPQPWSPWQVVRIDGVANRLKAEKTLLLRAKQQEVFSPAGTARQSITRAGLFDHTLPWPATEGVINHCLG